MGTKIAGYLMIVASLINVAIDVLNGGGFDLSAHYTSVMGTLVGAGFIRNRMAIDKVIDKIK